MSDHRFIYGYRLESQNPKTWDYGHISTYINTSMLEEADENITFFNMFRS